MSFFKSAAQGFLDTYNSLDIYLKHMFLRLFKSVAASVLDS